MEATGGPPRLELTVDGIMRRPKLVGHPPTGLRWSGDSRELFFEQNPRDQRPSPR